MWEQYKKTLLRMQAAIVVLTVIAYFMCQRQVGAAAVFFMVMEVGAVAGAWWAASLKQRIITGRNRLPLERQRR